MLNRIWHAAAAAAVIAGAPMAATAQTAGTIKIGVLHSLSGTMAISETSLKDAALMTIEEINASHSVAVSHLTALANLIEAAVNATTPVALNA